MLVASCATQKVAQVAPVVDAYAEGSFLFLSAAAATGASNESLAQAMATMCDPACDRIYIDIDGDPPVEALHRVTEVATTLTPAPRVYVMPASKKAIELDTGAGECAVTVTVASDGASVWRDGSAIEPDPTCRVWNRAICRGEDAVYDWPRLRSEVGVLEEVCIAFETASAGQLAAIHETLRQPRVRLIRPPSAPSDVGSADVLAERVRVAGSDLQWCLDGEVADTEQLPMRATLKVAVHTDGSVTRVDVLEGIRTTSNFEACIADVAKKFVFDPPASPQVLSIRLKFEPGAKGPTVIDEE